MSEVKYTPGPWRTDALPGYATEVIAADGTTVAIYDTDPSEANARLIDAAPELLTALQQLLPHYRKAVKLYDPNTDDPFTVAARIAIAKATGGAA